MDFNDLSPELREKAQACTSPEELLALARREGHKLSDDALSAVSGGKAWSGAQCDKEIMKCFQHA